MVAAAPVALGAPSVGAAEAAGFMAEAEPEVEVVAEVRSRKTCSIAGSQPARYSTLLRDAHVMCFMSVSYNSKGMRER